MLKAVLTRIGWALLMLVALLILVFLLVRLTGDAARFIAPPGTLLADIERERRELGLDRPLVEQFVTYVQNLARGDMGNSFRTRQPVLEVIGQRAPNTLTLAFAAIIVITLVSIPVGVLAAIRQGGWFDRGVLMYTSIFQSVPGFWLGFILLIIFSVKLGWLPAGGYGNPALLILPVATISSGPIADLIRLVRTNMLEELGKDYVKFHRAKGLPERSIRWKHALRNASATTLTFLGLTMAKLFTGSVLIEVVFVWPGLGRLLVESLDERDFVVVQGVVLIFGAVFIVMNLLTDLSYVVLNPRLRGSNKTS